MTDEAEPGEADSTGPSPMDAAVRRALVESHRDLLRFLTRRLGRKDEAEEVLQRFMLKALERSNDLRDVRTVRGWLGRVLATTIVDHQRAAATRRKREQAVDPDTLANLPDALIEADAEIDEAVCQCLYKLLPTLKPEYSEVLWRADLLGEPRERVAVSLGTTVNNVTVRLHRARRALKIRLEQMCHMCVAHGFLDCQCEDAERLRKLRDAP
ncbi:RNA polymerase sigma factor [Sphingomonas canadensis]|uniref:RNA polymerase sigma factor n=1 Tax=Sphingomonas canadensis TaxID=1219257 RepID=A0ABW3HB96_9SPHN|nr:RNA polymerase sigma factor [Sphingomonas canadensis]MCW3837314.1 RNA polymerase sigma factor [Sphingomonas canadensis]